MCSKTLGPAILPSLLICPTTNTVMLFSLVSRMMRMVHSRTCVMLPGAEAMAASLMV